MREWLARVLDWLRRDRLDSELADELRFHHQHLERDTRADGKADAHHAARRQLGNLTRAREDARDRWSVPWLDHLQQDIRYALRGLRRSPGFTTAVVLTLGLGLGANAAMFNVIDQLMLRPFPYLREPAQVKRVYLRMPGRERLLNRESFPYSRYRDLQRWTTSFTQYAAFYSEELAVGTGDASRPRPIAAVSASFFDFFDAPPAVGRYFTAAEDSIPRGVPVAVLSHAYWHSAYGGRDVIGEPIQIDNMRCTIIGVAPEGFIGVADGPAPDVYMPITAFGATRPGGSSAEFWRRYVWDWAEMMVRVRPGVPATQANADLTQAYIRSRDVARTIHPFLPRTDPVRPLAVAGALKTAAGPYPGLESRTLVWIAGVAAVVLLIACANVANLFLARALRRRREIALRVALGVSRRRLLGQSLTESLVLSLIGCVVGVGIAQWGGVALRQLFLPADASVDIVTDWRTLGIALGAAIVAGLTTGFAPVLLADRRDIVGTLKAGVREGTYQRSRLRSTLLVTQVVLSVVLLVGAGLFVRSLGRLRALPLGYDANPVLMARWDRRGEQMSTDARVLLRRQMLETARAIPGVEHAAIASNVPLQGTSTMGLYMTGVDSVARLGRFTYQTASDDFFLTTGTRILRGRGITTEDRLGAPSVMVVSDAMARVLWPNRDPLGECLRVGADSMPCTRVVGIAENAVHDPLKDQPLRYYLPLEQWPNEGGSLLLVRMRGDAAAQSETVRRSLQAIMPGQQYVTVQPMTNLLDAQRRSWRVGATMFVAFGGLALVVAAIGLYGVIAYNVGQRMHELGVRIALGAQGPDVFRLVVGDGVRLAVAGVVIGCALAISAARWIEPLLFQQSVKDPSVFGMVSVVLLGVALIASAVPALRAMRADPNTVLRSD
ncbi:MAG TPA: ABC transporter permease [Gemmatimonadaceae bacterium]|nr:ABC transporter permease [Gemmatimonadaceae bacterium]